MASTYEERLSPETMRAKEEFIANLAEKKALAEQQGEIVDLYDKKFFKAGGRLEMIREPRPDKMIFPEAIHISTLAGLVKYINEDADDVLHGMANKYIVKVCSPTKVILQTQPLGYWRERCMLAIVDANVPSLTFGLYMGVEEFQVFLQSKFVQTENVEKLLRLTGSISKEHGTQVADDGVSQRVTIKSGISMNEVVTIRNPVPLQPYRTFPDIAQPESLFVYRVNDKGEAALFDGDGGAWIRKAVQGTADYLATMIQSPEIVTVIG